MKKCVKCRKVFNSSSRHLACSSCRKQKYKKPCDNCGALMQRKSKLCRKCFLESKQYPNSKKVHSDKSGYRYVYFKKHPYSDKSGRIYEHRLIMEKKLGRYLFDFENVHHKNGVRSDNRIKNLELWVKVQPAGVKVQDVVKWARKIIKIYGDVSSVG